MTGVEVAAERLLRAATAGDALVLVARADGVIVGICTTYLDFESVRFGRRARVEDLAARRSSPGRGSRRDGRAGRKPCLR
jgi:hypothetical protein